MYLETTPVHTGASGLCWDRGSQVSTLASLGWYREEFEPVTGSGRVGALVLAGEEEVLVASLGADFGDLALGWEADFEEAVFFGRAGDAADLVLGAIAARQEGGGNVPSNIF
jgi:hypothetical protein